MSDLDHKTAFEQLLLRNRGKLTAISSSYANSDADDLLQEILLQIWRSLSSFEGRSNIDTWCYRIALNTAISWRRTVGKREQRLPSSEFEIGQVPGADDGHKSFDLLRQFLQTLSDADRALVLMYLEDMSGTEMAEVLGVKEGTLRVRIHRIKQRLAEWKVSDT